MGVAIGVGILVLVVAILVVVPRLAFRTTEPSLRAGSPRRTRQTRSSSRSAGLTLGLESRGSCKARERRARAYGERADLVSVRSREQRSSDPAREHHEGRHGQVAPGQVVRRDLLRVTFMNDGKSDSMAWYVTDLGVGSRSLVSPQKRPRKRDAARTVRPTAWGLHRWREPPGPGSAPRLSRGRRRRRRPDCWWRRLRRTW